MKKTILILSIAIVSLTSTSQNKKFIASMEKNVAATDTSRSNDLLQPLANTFERIANAEKSEWLPNYYVAFCNVNMTYNVKGDAIDTYCDKAEKFIHIADSLNPNNSEIYTLKAQIAGARISVNPMTRGQKYGTMAAELREKAKQLDAKNPRPYYLEGTSLFYTPAAFGGSKEKAKLSFQKAKDLFEGSAPVGSIEPHWGRISTEMFLKKCDEK